MRDDDSRAVAVREASGEAGAHGPKVWRAGSLTYTRGGLANVFLWMLWGDFCLNLMDAGVVANLVPLQMKKYGASGMQIGLLTGTVTEVMSMLMVAVISTWSDRHRGRLGRRMPFMLWSTPPLVLFLVLMGFSPGVAGWMKEQFPGVLAGVSLVSLTVGTMAVTMAAYKFFDIFPQSVYYYLWPDVIPAGLMGRFACLFRVVAGVGVGLFNLFLLKHAEDRPGMICLLAGALYLFAFVMLAVMVKEGEYPAPERLPEGRPVERSRKLAARYVRECFSHTYYWKIYLFNVCFICALAPSRAFLIFYAREVLHIELQGFGWVMAILSIVQAVLFLALGPVVDRYHPLRVTVVGSMLSCATGILAFVFIRGETSFAVWTIAAYASAGVISAATLALGPRILPQKQYGQFCSANSVVYRLGMAAVMPAAGLFFDRMGYQYLYAWFGGFMLVSCVLVVMIYRDWKRLGGDENYVAPVVEEEPAEGRGGFEVVMSGNKSG